MRLLLGLVFVAFIAGCGGGGGDSGGSEPVNAAAAGLWTGTTNNNRTVTGVVLSDGTYYVLYSAQGNPSVIGGVVQGSGSVNGTSFTSNNGRDFNLEGAGVSSTTVSATVAREQTFAGSIRYSGTGATTTFNTTYNRNFEVTPTLAAVAGTYSGNVAFSQGVQAATVTVSSTGALSGGANGCIISGSVTPRTDGNVYNLTMTFGPAPCFFANQTFTGIAYYDSALRRVYAAAPNPSRTDGVLFVGTKP